MRSLEDEAVLAELVQRWALEREDVQIPPKLRKRCRAIGERQRATAGGSAAELEGISAQVLDLLDEMNGRRQTVLPKELKNAKETCTSAPLIALMRLLLWSGDDPQALCRTFAPVVLPPEVASTKKVDRIFVKVGAAARLLGAGGFDTAVSPDRPTGSTDRPTAYVNCYLDAGPKQQTKQVDNDSNPEFGDEFVFFLPADPSVSELRFKVQEKTATTGLNDEFLGEVKIRVADLLADAQAEQTVETRALGDPQGKLSRSMKKQVERRASESLASGSNEPFGRIALSFGFDTSSNGHRVDLIDAADASSQAVSQWNFSLSGTDAGGGEESFLCRWDQAKTAHGNLLKLFPFLERIEFPSASLTDKALDEALDTAKPKGFVGRARRRSVAMVVGTTAKPNAAQLASMAALSEDAGDAEAADAATPPPVQQSSHARRGQELLKYFTQVFMDQGVSNPIFLAQFRKKLEMETQEMNFSPQVTEPQLEPEPEPDRSAAEILDIEAVTVAEPERLLSSDLRTSSRTVSRATTGVDLSTNSSEWSVEENFCLALLRACQPTQQQDTAGHCSYVCIAKRGMPLHPWTSDAADDVAYDEPREAAIQQSMEKNGAQMDKQMREGFEDEMRILPTAKLCSDSGVQFVRCGEIVTIEQTEKPFGSTIRMRCNRRNGESGWVTLFGAAPVGVVLKGISTYRDSRHQESVLESANNLRRFVAIPTLPLVGNEYKLREQCDNYAKASADRRNDLDTKDGRSRSVLEAGFEFIVQAIEETSSSRLPGVIRVQTAEDQADGRWVDLLHCESGQIVLTPCGPSEGVPPPQLFEKAGVVVMQVGAPSISAPTSQAAAESEQVSDVDAWLTKHRLGKYAASLKEEGYDVLSFLQEDMTEKNIEELAATVEMKTPHAKAFLRAWKELVAGDGDDEGATSGDKAMADEPEPELELDLEGQDESSSESEDEDAGLVVLEPGPEARRAPPPAAPSRAVVHPPEPAPARLAPPPPTRAAPPLPAARAPDETAGLAAAITALADECSSSDDDMFAPAASAAEPSRPPSGAPAPSSRGSRGDDDGIVVFSDV